MKKIFYLFLLANIIACISARSQESPTDIIRSPQVADMIRYDNTPVALNSGRLDLNIPLLALEDPDFSFPVTACYNSAGFMPAKPEGSIGLDWSLSMGGVIYREVRGMADDLEGNDNMKGFLRLLKDKKSYNPQSVAANPSQYLSFVAGPVFKDTHIEATPDLYRFSFGEYSGYFSIGYDGTVQVVSEKGGSLKVDLSGYEYFTTYNKATIIKITADNGYQYYFGGSKDNMEYSIRYTNNLGHASGIIYPSAFFLYKVVAPNGRSLDISYKKIPNDYNNYPLKIMDEQNYKNELKNYTINFSFTGFFSLVSYTGNVVQTSNGFNVEDGRRGAYEYTLTKIALIDEVTCGAQKMKFYYSPRAVGQERFKDVAFTLSSRCGAMLDSINVQYQNKPVKRVKFQYSYSSGTYPAFFLTQLTMLDGGVYKFSYLGIDQLPNPVTANTDYWNFFRNRKVSDSLIPEITIYNNYDYKYTSDVREPNPEYCDVTLLGTITYPTGGSAQISYEPHTYSKKLDRTAATAFKPTLVNLKEDAIAGGARVKKINYYDNNKFSKSIAYEYTNSKTDRRSSGTLYYYPKYFDIQKYMVIYQDSKVFLSQLAKPAVTFCNVALNIPSYEQDHVRYSAVREVNVENTSGGNRVIACSVAYDTPSLSRLTSWSVKKGIEYWEISGMKSGGDAIIYLKQNGVTKKTLTIKDDNLVRYVPDVEDGKYDIYTIKNGVYGFVIKVYTPAEYEGFYKETKFTDYSTNPDNFLDDKVYCEVSGFTPSNYEYNSERMPQDRSKERGQILSENNYDRTNKLVKSVNYGYTSSSSQSVRYTYHVNSYNAFMQQLNKTYYYPVQLRQKTQSTYGTSGNSNPMTHSETYTYNSDGYLSEFSTMDSSQKTVKHKYTYPADYSSESVYSSMLSRNMRSYRIQQETYVNNTLREKIRNNYVLSGSLPVLGNIQRGRGSTFSATLANYGYGGNQQGRPMSVVYRDGRKEVYLWSYNYGYIVAKIEGVTYDEVKNILGESFITSLASNSAPTEAAIEQIRIKLLANVSISQRVLVTTYLYKPLVGMAHEIAPNGEKTSYSYNGNNQLQMLRDHSGKIVEQYEYNYKH